MSEPNKIELEIKSESERERHGQTEVSEIIQEKFEVPANLKKTLSCTISLFVLGIVLIIIGFVEEVNEKLPGQGIACWVLGGIVLIPGGYYSYQFYKAMKATDPDERNDILEEIPQI